MTLEELRQFIIDEVKEKKPDEPDPEGIADAVLSQPYMCNEAAVKAFLEGFNSNKGGEHE